MNRFRLLALLALVWAFPVSAQDWGEIAQISTTLGVQANRLCLGEGSRGDIGCPSYAPYVNATSGYVGIGTTSVVNPLDIATTSKNLGLRLMYASSTVRVIPHSGAIAYGGLVQDGDAQLYFHGGSIDTGAFVLQPWNSNSVGLRMISTGAVAFGRVTPTTVVDISGTIRVSNSGETCDANRAGAIRWHESAGQFQVCYGSGGWALLSSAATSGTTADSDRITSDTSAVVANGSASGGYISLTAGVGGTEWGYLGASVTYLPNIQAATISTTGTVSAASVFATSKLAVSSSLAATQLMNVGNGFYSASYPVAFGRSVIIGQWGLEVGKIALLGASGQIGSIDFQSAKGLNFYSTSTNNVWIGSESGSANAKVGVNTSYTIAPLTTLDVSGTLKIANAGETCDANRAGGIRWHGGAGQFQVCYGSGGWATLSSAATSGTTTTPDRIVSGTTEMVASTGGISVTFGVTPSVRFDAYSGMSVFARDVPSGDTYWTANPSERVARFMKKGNAYVQVLSRDNEGVAGLEFFGAGQRGRIYGTATYDMFISPNDQYGATNIIMANQTGANSLRVGIGGLSTSTPVATLDVSGSVKVAGTGSETCGPTTRGSIRQNPATRKLEVCRY